MKSRISPMAVLFSSAVLDLLGLGILLPLLPTYGRDLGASDLEVGLLYAIFSLVQVVFLPLWGRLSDRVGRRPVLLVTAVGMALHFVVFGVANSLWVLFVARAFGGVCGASLSTAQAYVADITKPEERAAGMALIGAALGVGLTIGPALAGVTADLWGVRAPFFIAAGLALLNVLWIAVALPEPEHHVKSDAQGLRSLLDAFRLPVLAFYMVVFFIVTYAFSHIEAIFVLWNADELGFSERDNGLLFSYIGVVLVLVQGLGMRFITRWASEFQLIVYGQFIMAAGVLVIPMFVHNWVDLGIAVTIMATGHAVSNPSLMSVISRNAPVERQGEMLGVTQSLASVARIAGPAVGAVLYGYVGHSWPFLTTAAVIVLITLVIMAKGRGRGS